MVVAPTERGLLSLPNGDTIGDEAAAQLVGAMKATSAGQSSTNFVFPESEIVAAGLPIDAWRAAAVEKFNDEGVPSLRFTSDNPQHAQLMEALSFVASGKYTPKLRADGKKLSREVELIAACLFINRKGVINDTEKAELVKLLGQVITEGDAHHGHEYFIPHKAIQSCLGDIAVGVFDQAVREKFISEQKSGQDGFIVGPKWIKRLEEVTGKTLAEAQELYQKTRPSGERHIG